VGKMKQKSLEFGAQHGDINQQLKSPFLAVEITSGNHLLLKPFTLWL